MEPEWIEHDGSAACPVPLKQQLAVRWKNGTTSYGLHACLVNWEKATHYRDWTAWEQSKMTKDDDAAARLIRAVIARYTTPRKIYSGIEHVLACPKVKALIAELRGEPAPVDPLVELLREMNGVWHEQYAHRILEARPAKAQWQAEWLRARSVTLDPTRERGEG